MPHAIVSPAAMRIVKLLAGNPPQSISELTRASGVTRTAVAEQLDELLKAGYVERTTERPGGRGRPRHLFVATRAALVQLFDGNQALVVPAIWQAVRESGGEALVRKVLHRVGAILADHYIRQISAEKPIDRLRQFMELLAGEGVLLDIRENSRGQLELRKRSCPFLGMADPDRSVCRIDLDMMSAVVGRPVRRIVSRFDDGPCCTFEIVEE